MKVIARLLQGLVTVFMRTQSNFFEFFGWNAMFPRLGYSGLARIKGRLGMETGLDTYVSEFGFQRLPGKWIYESNTALRKRVTEELRRR